MKEEAVREKEIRVGRRERESCWKGGKEAEWKSTGKVIEQPSIQGKGGCCTPKFALSCFPKSSPCMVDQKPLLKEKEIF